MTALKPAFLFALVVFVAPVWAQNLNCQTGPANKLYGEVPWLVYACDDGHSVILVSAPGGPAMPFYFSFTYEGAGYQLRGEGSGNKVATDRALAELSKLRERQIAELFTEATRAAKR